MFISVTLLQIVLPVFWFGSMLYCFVMTTSVSVRNSIASFSSLSRLIISSSLFSRPLFMFHVEILIDWLGLVLFRFFRTPLIGWDFDPEIPTWLFALVSLTPTLLLGIVANFADLFFLCYQYFKEALLSYYFSNYLHCYTFYWGLTAFSPAL